MHTVQTQNANAKSKSEASYTGAAEQPTTVKNQNMSKG